jgi:hypothetical protein
MISRALAVKGRRSAGPGPPTPGRPRSRGPAGADGPPAGPRRLPAEATEPREHAREPIELSEDRIRFPFDDESECEGRFDGGCRFVALCARAPKPLPSIVPVARCCFGEIEIRAEERAPHLIAERAVSAG